MNGVKNIYDPFSLGRKVKRLINEKNLTVREFAKKANLKKTTVERLIKGQGIRLETLYIICNSLDIIMEQLFSENEKDIDYRYLQKEGNKLDIYEKCFQEYGLIKSDDYTNSEITINSSEIELMNLHFHLPGGSLNAVIFNIKREGPIRSHQGEEMVTCIEGKIRVFIAGIEGTDGTEYETLKTGDSIFFWANKPHQIKNITEKGESLVQCVWTDPDFTKETYNN